MFWLLLSQRSLGHGAAERLHAAARAGGRLPKTAAAQTGKVGPVVGRAAALVHQTLDQDLALLHQTLLAPEPLNLLVVACGQAARASTGCQRQGRATGAWAAGRPGSLVPARAKSALLPLCLTFHHNVCGQVVVRGDHLHSELLSPVSIRRARRHGGPVCRELCPALLLEAAQGGGYQRACGVAATHSSATHTAAATRWRRPSTHLSAFL